MCDTSCPNSSELPRERTRHEPGLKLVPSVTPSNSILMVFGMGQVLSVQAQVLQGLGIKNGLKCF